MARATTSNQDVEDETPDVLDADDAAEEIGQDGDEPMDDGDEVDPEDEIEEIQLQNDSAAYFDHHKDSIFCVAQHPTHPSIVVTGGGDDVAYIFDSAIPGAEPGPPLPASYESGPRPQPEHKSIEHLQQLDGHTDSVNAVAFTQPYGEYVATAGLDGKLRVWVSSTTAPASLQYSFLAESSEVQEINWLATCPSPAHANVIALGASDGSVWVYTIDARDLSSPLSITQVYYLHTQSCTAGSWTPDGKLLATISEDSSLQVLDVWGEAASALGISPTNPGQALITLTATDQRFAVDGGLYSIAISPSGSLVAVGGAGGNIRIVSLPRLASKPSSTPAKSTTKQPSKSRPTDSFGVLLATLSSQTDGVEALAFSPLPLTLLAAGSVDGSIHIFDAAHGFVLKRALKDAHEGYAVVKLDFSAPTIPVHTAGGNAPGPGSSEAHFLTSAGMDGVLRRWDVRGGSTGVSTTTGSSGSQGLVREWKGHRGEGEGGGVLDFVQARLAARDGQEEEGVERIVTAGDDGVALIFRV